MIRHNSGALSSDVLLADTAHDQDAMSIWKRGQELKKQQLEGGNEDDGMYRGLNGYQTFNKPKEDAVFTTGAGGAHLCAL